MKKEAAKPVYGSLEHLMAIHAEHERVRKRFMKKPVGNAQLLILIRLAAIWKRQKNEARHFRTRFTGGWTHVRTGRFTRLESLRGLLRRGLASACCDGHDGTDMVRITPEGFAWLTSNGFGDA